ncbi:unnamed protein product, partial [Staurois parvus]
CSGCLPFCANTDFFPFNLYTALGAAYGTAKSGTGIAAMSVMRPELIMKSIIPVVMAGIIAIYGLGSGSAYCKLSHIGHLIIQSRSFLQLVCWPQCRIEWPCCWVRHWHCGRCRCAGNSTTAPTIRRHDPDPHFC